MVSGCGLALKFAALPGPVMPSLLSRQASMPSELALLGVLRTHLLPRLEKSDEVDEHES